MRDRQPTETERTWIDDLLGSPGVRDTLRDGNTVQIDAQWGGESTASGTATGENPNLDLGGVSGDGGGSVLTLERFTEADATTPTIIVGGLLIVAGIVLFRLRATTEAMIAGAAGAFLIAGAFYPLALLGVALALVAGVVWFLLSGPRRAALMRTLGDVVTAVDAEPAARDAVKVRMNNNDATGKKLVKKARADAAKRKGQ